MTLSKQSHPGAREVRIGMTIDGLGARGANIIIVSAKGITAAGVSRCDPRDKPDSDIGHDLALGRALTILGNRLQKRARGKIKHNDDVQAQRERLAQMKAEGRAVDEVFRTMRANAQQLRDEAEKRAKQRHPSGSGSNAPDAWRNNE